MTNQVALSVNDVHVRYGDAEVLRGVNIKVNVGEAVTLIGANGAGKTTLLKNYFRIAPTGSGNDHVRERAH